VRGGSRQQGRGPWWRGDHFFCWVIHGNYWCVIYVYCCSSYIYIHLLFMVYYDVNLYCCLFLFLIFCMFHVFFPMFDGSIRMFDGQVIRVWW
jgi:hypothetical protein